MSNPVNERPIPSGPLASISTEQALLGGLLADPTPVQQVIALVDPEDFFNCDHRIIFSVMCNLCGEGIPIDLFLVAERASKCAKKNLQQYLIEIASNSVGSANAQAYAQVIKDLAIKRAVMQSAHAIIEHVQQKGEETAEQALSFAQQQIIRVSGALADDAVIATPSAAFQQCLSEIDRKMNSDQTIFGLSSGFEAIDRYTGGYSGGELIILAGRPSMGKSTLAICSGAAMGIWQAKRGVFFTLEMPQNQVMNKLTSCLARIDYRLLKNPKLVRDHEDFWVRMQKAASRIKGSGFHIVDCPGYHINQIGATARKMHLTEPLHWIMIDHMHLVRGDGKSDIERLTQISNSAKRLARELNVPVILLAQLNRGVEQRVDKRPTMGDIRGSGSVEQDADIIHFIYRDDYYNKSPDNPNRGLVEVETAKQRDGELGIAVLENAYAQSRLVPTHRKIVQQMRPRSISLADEL